MAVKNKAASVLERLKQQAKSEKLTFQMVLQLFFQEELLRKLATTKYAENLILKGGMFIYTLTEFESRPTRDIDFLMRWLSNDLDGMKAIMTEICITDTGNEFITLEVKKAEEIAVDKKYPGVRIKFMGHISNVRVPFTVDIGIDDIVVPEAIKRKIATRLPDFDAPEIYTYSLESTIAEKLDTILQRMETTSRMKDFYDIYYLSEIFDFEGALLLRAIRATLEHRKRVLDEKAFLKIADFGSNSFLNIQWKAFEPARIANLSFETVLERMEKFLSPIFIKVVEKGEFGMKWESANKRWV